MLIIGFVYIFCNVTDGTPLTRTCTSGEVGDRLKGSSIQVTRPGRSLDPAIPSHHSHDTFDKLVDIPAETVHFHFKVVL